VPYTENGGGGSKRVSFEGDAVSQRVRSYGRRSAALALAIAGTVVVVVQPGSSSAASERRAEVFSYSASSPTWSPDGTQIAYIGHKPTSDANSLFVMRVSDGGHKRVIANTGSQGINEVRWTSRRRIVFSVLPLGNLSTVDPVTGHVTLRGKVDELPNPGDGFTTSLDGSLLGLTTRCIKACTPYAAVEIGIASASGGPVRMLPKSVGDSEQEPSFSPDGTQVVFARSPLPHPPRAGEGDPTLFVEPTAGGPARSLEWNGWFPQWSPDGKWIAFITSGPTPQGDNLVVAIVSVDGGQAYNLGRADDFSWSPDSSQLAFTTEDDDGTIGTVDLSGSRHVFSIGRLRVGVGTPQWSPDLKHLAFTGLPGRATSVYVIGADGGGLRRLS
jgi:Tol biopolymer transport system component